MILGHHGGEVTLVQAALASAGSVPLLLLVFRTELDRIAKRVVRRRRPAGADRREVSPPAPCGAGEASPDPASPLLR